MSGHSKWSTIKRKKEITDQKRGAIFSKLSRVITMAVINGGSNDPAFNITLRLAILRARSFNMPKINIDRAVLKASSSEAKALREMVYEGFGPSGVSFIITATTDNPSRTVSAIKQTLEKNNGKLGSENSVKHFFKKYGIVVFDKENVREEDIFIFSEEFEAYDIESGEEYVVYIPFDKMGIVHESKIGSLADSVEVWYKPEITIPVTVKIEEKIHLLIGLLEDIDEVENVYTNYTKEI